MWRSILSSMSLIASALFLPAPSAAQIPLPSGSYLQSCKVVSFDSATGELAATCDGPAVGMFGLGTPDTSRMNITGCKEGTIWNDQRQLYCLSGSAWGAGRAIPDGSYIRTCTDRQIVGGALLTARCDNGNGVAVNASLDLRPCDWGKDISNVGGALRCGMTLQPSMAPIGTIADQNGSDAVAKPVPVEPGLVKPVTIGPLAPADEGTTEDKNTGKKKKRRDRGERG